MGCLLYTSSLTCQTLCLLVELGRVYVLPEYERRQNMRREETKVVQIGNCKIGGGNPVAIQSMTNTKTEDVEATVAQILALEAAAVSYTHLESRRLL